MRLKHVKNADIIINQGTYYINDPTIYKGSWSKLFNNTNPIYIEIGIGKGTFIIENALKYPNINFIGIEKFDSVIVRAIEKSNSLELNNLKLIRMDAEQLSDIFSKEISLLYLNFSDPWPKAKHAKRRLTSPKFLSIYDNIFKDTKHIIMKTDNNPLFDYSLETLVDNGYKINYQTRDLHKENPLDNIMTEYEAKFVTKGIKINKLDATKE